MSDIFISCARADRARAKILAKALERQGWSVWWDPKIPPGKTFDEVIEEALNAAKCVVVIWSKASVVSDWVKTEAAEGKRRKILVPALIDDVEIPLEFRRIQAARLVDWQGKSPHPEFDQLSEAISKVLGHPVSPETSKALDVQDATKTKLPINKKLFVLSVAILMILVFIGTYIIKTNSQIGLPFEDNLNDGDANGWEPQIPKWSVVENQYFGASTAGRAGSLTVIGEKNWTDYTISADIRPISEMVNVGIIGRFQDAENFYMAQLRQGVAGIHMRITGRWIALDSVPHAMNKDTWYKVKLEMRDTRIRMYVDGALVASAKDATFSRGKIGLRSAEGAEAYFDNVTVKRSL